VSISRRVGRYTLRSLLGRGGMGEVYQAYDERLRRHVAIKRIHAAAGDDPQRRARFEQEARLLAQLVHPAIVQVFDIFDDETGDWVVMELVEGRTLAALLEHGPLGVDDVLRYGHAIAAGLDAAHRQGIIHRDLKVENVMLSNTGQIKILDFGLAKRSPNGDASSAALSSEGQVLGTVRAMSPEQARGLAVDERSDLFSLGVLLYELLARVTPFSGTTPVATVLRVTTDRQRSLVELPGMAVRIPHALSALVDQLLEKAVEQRPASAAEVRDHLQAMAESRAAMTSAGAPVTERWAAPAGSHPGRMEPRDQDTQISSSNLAAPGPPQRDRETEIELGPTALRVPPAGLPPATPRRWRRRLVMAVLGAALAGSAIVVGAGALRPAPADASLATPVAAPLPSAAPQGALASARDPRAEYERGMTLLRNYHRPGAVDEAAGIFQRLLRDDEASAPGYAGLARAYWVRSTFTDASQDAMFLQQARAAADRAVALDEFLVDGRVSHGLVALQLGQEAQAERDFQAAIALDGKSADAFHGEALLRKHQQRLDEAEAAFRKAIELAPGARDLYDDLGGLQVQRGKYQDAIPLFEHSIALAPDSPYGYSNLGAVYLLQGRYADAAQRFQDALKIRPLSSLYSNLGTVLFAQGLYGPAANAFERALAMGGAANSAVYWGNLADAYRQLPEADQAREAYDHAIRLFDAELAQSPQDLTLRSRRVLDLAKRGDCQRAGDGLASMIDASDAPAYAVFRMAVALEICGQRQRAITTLERALASGFSPAEIGNDPELRALRADPGYLRMIDRRGQPPVTTGSHSGR
jgi:serine/threonine-protein kinase